MKRLRETNNIINYDAHLFYNKDIFILLCEFIYKKGKIENLISLELLSKFHYNLIREDHFNNIDIKFNKKIKYNVIVDIVNKHNFNNLNFQNFNLMGKNIDFLTKANKLNLDSTCLETEMITKFNSDYKCIILDNILLVNIVNYDDMIINNKKLINAQNILGDNILIYILKNYYIKYNSIKFLIRLNININHINNNGYNALYYAVCNGYIEIVELLLSSGCDVNMIYKKGSNILILCVKKGYFEIFKKLIDYGVVYNFINGKDKTTFMYAIKNGNCDIINWFLNKSKCFNLCSY
jgi:hypothetical protein